MSNGYDSAWDWCDVQIEDYGEFLSRDEMEEYLTDNFADKPIGESDTFWDRMEGLLEGYYGY